jgi:putative hydrolase of the HAD superfamily
MSPRYKAVTLDAGGTLFHMERPVGEVYSEFASRFGKHTDPRKLEEKFRALFIKRSSTSPDAGHLTPADERIWWKALVHELFDAGKGGFTDFDRFFDELHAHFANPSLWKMYPETIDSLERLRAGGVRMAIVSNWDTRLPLLVSRMGVDRFMDAVVVSAIEKASKPAPRIFQVALERLNLPAADVVHVGDSLRDDIRGAMAMGMGAIWLRRGEGGIVPGEEGLQDGIEGLEIVQDLAGAAGIILGS